MKLTIGIVFRSNKTFFTHFDCDYVQIKFFCDSKQETVDFLIKSELFPWEKYSLGEQSLYLDPKLLA